jgi:hypothetical protein
VAGQGFNELGIVGRVAKYLPEFLDGVVQTVVELDECVCGPQAAAQILPRDHLSGMFNEAAEHLEDLGRDRDFLTVFVEFPGDQVQLELAKTDSLRRLDRNRHGTAHLSDAV